LEPFKSLREEEKREASYQFFPSLRSIDLSIFKYLSVTTDPEEVAFSHFHHGAGINHTIPNRFENTRVRSNSNSSPNKNGNLKFNEHLGLHQKEKKEKRKSNLELEDVFGGSTKGTIHHDSRKRGRRGIIIVLVELAAKTFSDSRCPVSDNTDVNSQVVFFRSRGNGNGMPVNNDFRKRQKSILGKRKNEGRN